jgi:hypothetical protein
MVSDPRDGFATPAAAVICFTLAVVAAATVARSLGELKLAKAELARTDAEYELAAAHQAALISIATGSRPPPYHWTVAAVGKAIDVIAEPERPKMSIVAARDVDDVVLRALGVVDVPAARARLAAMGDTPRLTWVSDVSPSELWRRCASAYISSYGASAQPALLVYNDPLATQQAGLWRAGEVWRISASNAAGWRDERIVRFTGDGLHPAAVLGRRLSKNLKGPQTCEALLPVAA